MVWRKQNYGVGYGGSYIYCDWRKNNLKWNAPRTVIVVTGEKQTKKCEVVRTMRDWRPWKKQNLSGFCLSLAWKKGVNVGQVENDWFMQAIDKSVNEVSASADFNSRLCRLFYVRLSVCCVFFFTDWMGLSATSSQLWFPSSDWTPK